MKFRRTKLAMRLSAFYVTPSDKTLVEVRLPASHESFAVELPGGAMDRGLMAIRR